MTGAAIVAIARLAVALLGVALVIGLYRAGGRVERERRKHAETDLDHREKFDETYRKARGGAYNRAVEWLRRHPRE